MEILNCIIGMGQTHVTDYFDVINPATGEVIAKTPCAEKTSSMPAKAASEPSLNGDGRPSTTACSIF